MSVKWAEWKAPGILLGAVGISYVGEFVYLVALNLLIYAKTNSVAAVAGLWLIGPIAGILTGPWAGSVIDRVNKKMVMIGADLIRALLVVLIPFLSDLWLIYSILFLISLSSSFFNPASGAYTVLLVPRERLLRYNSISSILITGSLVIGPAIAGFLVSHWSYNTAIWANAASFLLSAALLSFLPSLHAPLHREKEEKSIRQDWKMVWSFLQANRHFLIVFLLFQGTVILGMALDSQEVVFTQKIIGLTERDFSLLMSITGAGYLSGSLLMAGVAKRLKIPHLIGYGSFLFSIGYVIYAFASSFAAAAIGFIILGFFSAFSNTGFQTFFQQSVPAERMGRVASTLGVLKSIGLILFTVLAGVLSETLGIKVVVVSISLGISGIAFALLMATCWRREKVVAAQEGV
ncbi:MFS transporter [Rossellomorea sp. H39__3]|uniref:MFS transporter n=1 Tax=Rossellomorea marisflavi TaxID=189381 RepID=UPI003D2EED1D